MQQQRHFVCAVTVYDAAMCEQGVIGLTYKIMKLQNITVFY